MGLRTRKRHRKLSPPPHPHWRELISRASSQLIRLLPGHHPMFAQLIGAFSPTAYGVKKNVPQPPTVTSTGVSTSASECYYQLLGPRLAYSEGCHYDAWCPGKEAGIRGWSQGCFYRDEHALNSPWSSFREQEAPPPPPLPVVTIKLPHLSRNSWLSPVTCNLGEAGRPSEAANTPTAFYRLHQRGFAPCNEPFPPVLRSCRVSF